MRDIVAKKYLKRFGGACVGLVIFFCVQLALLKWQMALDVHITKEMDDRLRCMLVLDEFRLTDQKLTRYARAYCETKDDDLWKTYDYIYDWSIGKTARPLQLDPELSFGVKGATISQMEILRQSDVPDHLLAYFREAVKYSDSLAEFELQAMKTIRDDKIDADGPSTPVEGETPTKFASRIIYDNAYQDKAAKLASCLEDFSRLYNKMKNHDIHEHRQELVAIYWWTLAIQVGTVLSLGLFLGKFFTTFRHEEAGIRRDLADSNVRLNQVTYTMALMENELKMAGQIQQEFLPPPFELQTNPVIWGKMIPAKATGGDFYDYQWIDPNHLGFSIGDVSGKGMSAAMFMARTLTLFRAGIAAMGETGYDIAHLVGWINRQLVERNDHSMFVTFYVGILDKVNNLFRYCNAGHHFALVIRKDGRLDIIETTPDLLMGIDAGYRYQEYSVPVEIGDTIILYTDGVVEAFSDQGDLYGEKRLHDFLKTQSISTKEAGAIVDILIGHVQQFAGSSRQSDDITVLVTKYQ